MDELRQKLQRTDDVAGIMLTNPNTCGLFETDIKEIADLISQVEDSGVSAIFGSEVFPSPVLEQIGRETGVTYIDVLRDDDLLGEPGDPEHSFLGLMQFDYVTMIEALGGEAQH